jgi:hypothetical protein
MRGCLTAGRQRSATLPRLRLHPNLVYDEWPSDYPGIADKFTDPPADLIRPVVF